MRGSSVNSIKRLLVLADETAISKTENCQNVKKTTHCKVVERRNNVKNVIRGTKTSFQDAQFENYGY